MERYTVTQGFGEYLVCFHEVPLVAFTNQEDAEQMAADLNEASEGDEDDTSGG